MKKVKYLKNVQERLPNEIVLFDETNFDFTEDEFIGILSWIKYFNHHYSLHKREKYPEVMFPIISKRLRLDFGLYIVPSPLKDQYEGKHMIFLSNNNKMFLTGNIQKQSVKQIINTWQL